MVDKKMCIRKKFVILTAFAFTLTIILFINSILAFAISAPYMGEEKQIKLMPGDSRNIEFTLQDAGATAETNAAVQIQEGTEIIQITDAFDSYTIPVGDKTSVNTRITIPSNAQIGDVYKIKLAFAVAAPDGGFAFGTSIVQEFSVIVGKEETPAPAVQPEKKEPNTLLYAIGILTIIIILLILFVIKKRSQ